MVVLAVAAAALKIPERTAAPDGLDQYRRLDAAPDEEQDQTRSVPQTPQDTKDGISHTETPNVYDRSNLRGEVKKKGLASSAHSRSMRCSILRLICFGSAWKWLPVFSFISY